MKILITESQYKRIFNEQPRFRKDGTPVLYNANPNYPIAPTLTTGLPNFAQPNLQSALNPRLPPLPIKILGNEDNNTKFHEPLGNPKKSVFTNTKMLPPQNDIFYFDGSNWIEKTVQNVDIWRNVPSGFVPSEYNEYLTKLGEINKIYSNKNKIPLNSAESSGIKTNPLDAKASAIRVLNNIYYNKKYPLGITNAQKKELAAKLSTTNKYYNDQITQSYGNSNINRGDFSATMHSQQIKGTVFQIQSQQKMAIDAIESQYNYWYNKKEEEGFDWITIIGFAMYLCPYTAAFAPYFTAAQGLIKAGVAFEKGDMKTAGLETLFALLPLGTVGKTLKSANILNAVDKLIAGKSLDAAEVSILKTMTSKSSIIKTELKSVSSSLLDKLPSSAKEEVKEWTKAMIDKAHKEGEKQASGYEILKDKLKEEGKKQDLETKMSKKTIPS